VLKRSGPEAFVRQAAHLHPLLAKVLFARHHDTIETAQAFLDGHGPVGDPFDLADMPAAVERVLRAVSQREPIVVYGDYDADGVTSTTLLVQALRAIGGDASAYIPDRFGEAYGLNRPALALLRGAGCGLVITVDCGIRSPAEVEYASGMGLDVIVTDHHTVPDALPPAVAVLNPKRVDSVYAFRDLAGVGVAYRLVQALSQISGGAASACRLDPESYLDLVALGTVADIVPLVGENRALVRDGLGLLRLGARPGTRALADAAGIRMDGIESRDIAFRLGPRLNGAGRLEHADLAYRLLMCESLETAAELAAHIDGINTARQTLLENQVAMARASLALDRSVLLVGDPEFHEGVVGLVASRLVESHYRPALVMCIGPDVTRGSARSVPGFHITRALEASADLLSQFGGHEQAAGFTLPTAHLDAFRERMLAYADAHLEAGMLERRRSVDAIVRLDEIDESGTAALAALGPFGEGNPEPAFASVGVEITGLRRMGRDGSHLRMSLRQGARHAEAVCFRQGAWAEEYAAGESVDLIYQPTIHEWQGQRALQLVTTAMRRHEPRS
jgi:single-stranded-DNA-specific exonuclease